MDDLPVEQKPIGVAIVSTALKAQLDLVNCIFHRRTTGVQVHGVVEKLSNRLWPGNYVYRYRQNRENVEDHANANNQRQYLHDLFVQLAPGKMIIIYISQQLTIFYKLLIYLRKKWMMARADGNPMAMSTKVRSTGCEPPTNLITCHSMNISNTSRNKRFASSMARLTATPYPNRISHWQSQLDEQLSLHNNPRDSTLCCRLPLLPIRSWNQLIFFTIRKII